MAGGLTKEPAHGQGLSRIGEAAVGVGNKISLDTDEDTYIVSDTDDEIQLFAGASEIVEFDATAVTIAASTKLVISDTTAATSSTTGALQVAGGIGVAGNSFFGGGLYVQSGGSPGGMGIYQKNTQGIADDTPTVIATSSTAMAGGITGGFGMVIGRKSDNSENQFLDLIIIPRVQGSTIVKAASTSDGSVPTTRTYTMSAERQITLNHTDGTTGTYDVDITIFGVNNPYIA